MKTSWSLLIKMFYTKRSLWPVTIGITYNHLVINSKAEIKLFVYYSKSKYIWIYFILIFSCTYYMILLSKSIYKIGLILYISMELNLAVFFIKLPKISLLYILSISTSILSIYSSISNKFSLNTTYFSISLLLF